MLNTSFTWQERTGVLLALCLAGMLTGCNDDPAAESPSLTEEHGLQVAATHYYERSLLTPEQAAERGFRYCPVYGHFFVAVRSATGNLPKEMTATVLSTNAPGMAPVSLEANVVGLETVNTSDQNWRQFFSDQKMPAAEQRLHVRGLACVPDDNLVKNSKLDLSLTVRSGGREAALGGVSNMSSDGVSIGQ